jgi:hypothetical protein
MDYHSELLEELKDFLNQLHALEQTFGATTALMRYGQDFRPQTRTPTWLRLGEPRNCFNNAATYAVVRSDVHYAEGYALEPELPIPVQHAWLVDRYGRVIDPTWTDTKHHVYFGLVFKREFVLNMLTQSHGQAGLLINMHLLRKQFCLPGQLQDEIRRAIVKRSD